MERCVARAVLRRPGKLASSDGDDRGFAIILATIKDGLWCLSVVCTLCALSALSLSHPQIETGIGSHMVMNHFAHSPAKYRVKRREIICFDKKVVCLVLGGTTKCASSTMRFAITRQNSSSWEFNCFHSYKIHIHLPVNTTTSRVISVSIKNFCIFVYSDSFSSDAAEAAIDDTLIYVSVNRSAWLHCTHIECNWNDSCHNRDKNSNGFLMHKAIAISNIRR